MQKKREHWPAGPRHADQHQAACLYISICNTTASYQQPLYSCTKLGHRSAAATENSYLQTTVSRTENPTAAMGNICVKVWTCFQAYWVVLKLLHYLFYPGYFRNVKQAVLWYNYQAVLWLLGQLSWSNDSVLSIGTFLHLFSQLFPSIMFSVSSPYDQPSHEHKTAGNPATHRSFSCCSSVSDWSIRRSGELWS